MCIFLRREVKAVKRVWKKGNGESCQRMLVVAGTKGQNKGTGKRTNEQRERVIGLDRHLREARKLVVMMTMFIIAITIILDP